jgi:hypothetical protein
MMMSPWLRSPPIIWGGEDEAEIVLAPQVVRDDLSVTSHSAVARRHQGRPRNALRQPDQVVRCPREGESPSDPVDAAPLRPIETGDGLHPA